MAKKRKSISTNAYVAPTRTKYDTEEKFDDSEDDFYTERDKILLDEQPAAKRRRRQAEQERDLQPSDEEVLRYVSDDDSDTEDATSSAEEDAIWGSSKADYYNADTIETEADALEEEAEARRLQQKQLKSMNEADFGLDEITWTEQKSTKQGPVIEKLPEIKLPTGASVADRLEILHSRYPEFEPLARDFLELHARWKELSGIRSRALSAYLGAIAMYFAVLTTTTRQDEEGTITALPPHELRDHAVIDNLIRTRRVWDAANNVKEVPKKEPLLMRLKEKKVQLQQPNQPSLPVESRSDEQIIPRDPVKLKKPEKKRRQKSQLLDLQTLLAQPAATAAEDSDFGDEVLTAEQAAEKAKKKKSLRFYTSQIAQKANKRGAASRDAGGDDDVPHKERMRDKQDRLMREAEKRGHQKPDILSDDNDENLEVQENEYYKSLVDQNKQKKAEKQARAEAYAEAARQGGQVYEEEQIVDGKRAITYAIEKNKGLMPKRKKDVRNPRVKKRKKYDEKKKKLSSMRQVYKGGEGRGGYGGELTGIKTNVIKSVKL